MLETKICVGHSVLYIWYASFLESKGKLYDAQMVYQMGILRSISSPYVVTVCNPPCVSVTLCAHIWCQFLIMCV